MVLTVSASFTSALVNDDMSGLDTQEQMQLQVFLNQRGLREEVFVSDDEVLGTCEVTGLSGVCNLVTVL